MRARHGTYSRCHSRPPPLALRLLPPQKRRRVVTHERVFGDRRLSWWARSPWAGSSVYPETRGGASPGLVAVVAWTGGNVAGSGAHLRSYIRRFDLEHAYCFLKQTTGGSPPLGCAVPSRPTVGIGWWWPLHAPLRLARTRVADLRPPWERCYDPGRLTPVRVHRAVSSLLAQMGTPAEAPRPCGKSPGRAKGPALRQGQALLGRQYGCLRRCIGRTRGVLRWDKVPTIPHLAKT